MLRKVQIFFDFLVYFFTSGNEHSVHSPFIFDFATNVLNARKNKPTYHEIELTRSRMMRSKSIVSVLPIGASGHKETRTESLRDVAERTSKSAKYAELLERICNYYQPQYAIEIGSSVGISTLYQASGINQGYLFSLEGNPDSVKIARHNAEKLGLGHIQFIEGMFDETLPSVVQQLPRVDYVFFDGNHTMEATLKYFETCLQKAHSGSIFIFDDIRWSDNMQRAWQKIKNHPQVTVTVDLFFMGIVFFRTEQEKQHFTLRF
jgi:predicted O-methyltransferase YrrM